jgi:nitrogen fixation-related uncharacterized protein
VRESPYMDGVAIVIACVALAAFAMMIWAGQHQS